MYLKIGNFSAYLMGIIECANALKDFIVVSIAIWRSISLTMHLHMRKF